MRRLLPFAVLLALLVGALVPNTASAYVFYMDEPTVTKPVAQPAQGNAVGNTWHFKYSYPAHPPSSQQQGTGTGCSGYPNGWCPNYKYCLHYRPVTSNTYTDVGCYFHKTTTAPNPNPPTTSNYEYPPLSLAGLTSGVTYEACISDWYYSTSVPAQWTYLDKACETTTIDSGLPTTSVSLDSGAAWSTDASIGARITYTDAVSAAWPSTYVCTTSLAGCTNVATFTYKSECSNYPGSGNSCSIAYGGADGANAATVCVSVADSAIPDNPSTTNQFVNATANYANLSAIQCDQIGVDRAAPTGSVAADKTTALTNENVVFTLTAADATSGVATRAWAGGGSGTSVTRSFASAGQQTVSVTVTDVAGNSSTFSKTITVTAPSDPGTGGTGGTGGTTNPPTTGGEQTPGGTTNPDQTQTPQPPQPLTNTVKPKLTGTRRVGKVMTCSAGTWSIKTGVTFTYAWKRGSAIISRQNKRTYKLVAADKGKRVSCVVTAKHEGRTVKAASVATLPVLAAIVVKK